jgi:integrase
VTPVFGAISVQEVTTDLVIKSLGPIWNTKSETASRVRGRIESILDWAGVRGLRTGENPARWRGHLDKLLPAPSKVQRVSHHAAMPYGDLPNFMAALRKQSGDAARALEFTIITAARSGETFGATWREIDLENAVWTIPGERMKSGRDHRVPLPSSALAILHGMLSTKDGDPVFRGQRSGRPLAGTAMIDVLAHMKRQATVHGFRSTFRDWAAETTDYAGEVVEMALAHAVGSAVEAAYRRGDLFEKRRLLMSDWAKFCGN